jgi:hypothetical protein
MRKVFNKKEKIEYFLQLISFQKQSKQESKTE